MEQKNLVHDHPAYHLTFWNILLYPYFFSGSDPLVMSKLWKKGTILSHRIVQCIGVMIVSRQSNSRKNGVLELLLSKLNQSIFVIRDDGEYVRIKLQKIHIIWCVCVCVCVYRACINAAFWHFSCQSQCIHSLWRLVAKCTTFTAKQARETYTYIACCNAERSQQNFHRHWPILL